jgi:hypothetical protein
VRKLGGNYFEPIYSKRNYYFERFLREKFKPLIQQFANTTEETALPFSDSQSAPIWQIWLQGESNRPALVSELFQKINENAENHPVRRISAKNFDDYIDIPSRIIDLYRSGFIGPAHFSDLLRVCLLKEYGGIWLDASVLLTQPIPNSILDKVFFSIHNVNPLFPLRVKCVNSVDWGTYFMSAQPGSLLFSYMSLALEQYFLTIQTVYDYLMPNHFYLIAFQDIPLIAAEYESIRKNNYSCEMLSPILEKKMSDKTAELSTFFSDDTYLFKLNLKQSYAETNPKTGKTYAMGMLEQYLTNQ